MGLAAYAARRAAAAAGVLAATLLITVAIVGSGMDSVLEKGVEFQVRSELAAGPPADYGGPEGLEAHAAALVEERKARLGLDEPWHSPRRVGTAMYRLASLDLGHASFLASGEGSTRVADIIMERLPRTVLLFTTATAAVGAAGVAVGAAAAARTGSAVDRAASGMAVVGASFPVWWVGMIMVFVFAFALGVLPARATPEEPPGSPGYLPALLYHMALPLATIVMVGAGAWAYVVRNLMVGVMQEDHIRARLAMGVPRRLVVYRHALRNAAPPIVTVMALSLSGSLGGAIVTEAVFDWPGMGRLYFEAVSVMDLPVILGATFVLTVFFLASVLAADLAYGALDPRTRRPAGAP